MATKLVVFEETMGDIPAGSVANQTRCFEEDDRRTDSHVCGDNNQPLSSHENMYVKPKYIFLAFGKCFLCLYLTRP